MSGLFEVPGGVAAGGGVTTSDISTDETLAQFDPALSGLNASLANIAARLDVEIRLFYMLALRHETSS